ncbi:MAG: hypothetical protein ABSA21_01185 [Candidatus Limnocylindrales bacterium]|jgi:hypothetical protein
MDKDRADLKSVDPKEPHGFVERMNLPYNIPKSFGPGVGGGPEIPFAKAGVPDDCELCGKRRLDPIHVASDEASDEENWPV